MKCIYSSFRECIQKRIRYETLSLQRPFDNPKHEDEYIAHPVPSSINDEYDWEIDPKYIPGKHAYNFELSEAGVYQVFDTDKDGKRGLCVLRVDRISNHFSFNCRKKSGL